MRRPFFLCGVAPWEEEVLSSSVRLSFSDFILLISWLVRGAWLAGMALALLAAVSLMNAAPLRWGGRSELEEDEALTEVDGMGFQVELMMETGAEENG